jgi:molecular chaperone GrpE
MSTPASSPGSSEEDSSDESSPAIVEEETPSREDSPPEEVQAGPEVVELAPMEVLKRNLQESEARLRMVSKAYTELQQDMASFHKRVEDQGQLKGNLKAFETVKTFFEPCQNLRRSLHDCGDDIGALVAGLRLILQQFDDGLEALGLEEIPGEGAVFNPEYHEALGVTPVPDVSLDGKVIIVHTVGYVVKGKVLQAAQVVVGKCTEEETPEA